MKKVDTALLGKKLQERFDSYISENKVGKAEYSINRNGVEIFHECYGNDGVDGAPLEKTGISELPL